MKKILPLLVAISSAIAGSICCVGPVLAGLAGIGAGALFVKFSTLRTPLLAIAIISLALGFYMVYLKKPKITCEDGKCEIKVPGKLSKLSLWLATFIIAFVIALPYVINVKSEHIPKGELPSINTIASGGLSSAIIEIEGLDCEACFISIKNALDGKNGIEQISPNFSKSELEVKFDRRKIKISDIVSSIGSTGFKIKKVKLNVDEK